MLKPIIYLEYYRTEGSKVFLGRDRGKSVAIESQILKRILAYDFVVIVIPSDIYSISPSFWEEFLDGVDTSKIKFINDGRYPHEKNYLEALDRIQRKKFKGRGMVDLFRPHKDRTFTKLK